MVMRSLEKAFGLPKIAEITQSVDAINNLLKGLDEQRMKSLTHIMDTMMKLQSKGGIEEMRLFSAIIQTIASIDMAKLEKVERITHDILGTVLSLKKLAKSLPAEALNQLPLKEIAQEVKKALAQKSM